jgi:hypothetical protein
VCLTCRLCEAILMGVIADIRFEQWQPQKYQCVKSKTKDMWWGWCERAVSSII